MLLCYVNDVRFHCEVIYKYKMSAAII